MKKKGFGQGHWNGPGGKIKPGETPEQATIREVQEETDLTPLAPQNLGYIEFIWEHKPENNQVCYIFLGKKFSGELQECEECRPQWWDINKIPYDLMWPDDIYWLPKALQGKKIKYRFFFDEKNAYLKHERLP